MSGSSNLYQSNSIQKGLNKTSGILDDDEDICNKFEIFELTHFPSTAVRAAKLAHPSGFFSPPISSHSLAPTPSAAVRAILRTHFRPQPSAQPSSLITSGFFSPTISSHSLAPTPSAAVRAILPTHFPSAAVRAAKLADLQRLLLPTHFQPLPGTHAVRSRPQPSAQFSASFPVRTRPRSQARSSPDASYPHPFPSSLISSGYFSPPISSHSGANAVRSRPRSSPHPVRSCPQFSTPIYPVRNRPRSQARSSPAASSPHPFPATPLHPRRPQPSAQFSAPISPPQPSAQPSSLISSGFFSPPISSHSLAPTPSAAVRAILRTHFPSAAVRAAKLADLQRLLLPTHFQPLPGTHAVRSRPRNSPHPFAVRSRPRSQARSSPSLPTNFQPLRCTLRPQPAKLAHQQLLLPMHPFPTTPQPSAQFSAPISRPQPSAQPSSLISSGFFSPPISSNSLAPTPSAAVRAILPTHLPSAAVRAAKLADLQRLLLPNHFQPLPCTHAVRSRPRSSPHPSAAAAKLAHHQRLFLPNHFQPLCCTHAVRSRPRSQAR